MNPPGGAEQDRGMRSRDERFARAVVRAEIDHGWAELVGDPDRPGGWTLLIDGTAQSHVDLDDPAHLEFEYMRRLGHLVDLLAPAGAGLRALHLGGGAWTLPRYVATTRPASVQRVVDIDAALVELVGARLPADGLGIEVVVGDARAALGRVPRRSVDLLVLDVFAGARTPAHLTSLEFVASAAAVLDGGVYAANVADGGALAFARSQVAAALATFDEVALVAPPEVLHGRRFGNLVLLGSNAGGVENGGAGLPLAELTRRVTADPFPARVLAGDQVEEFAAGAGAPTDRSAGPSPMPPPGFFGRPG
jgi:hypothetical protein